jgi:hypothetical protein
MRAIRESLAGFVAALLAMAVPSVASKFLLSGAARGQVAQF